ncbi:MAG: protein kinase [Planctomycetes bacterium]|nr:protein kinase [Planctomycetota bacterium]
MTNGDRNRERDPRRIDPAETLPLDPPPDSTVAPIPPEGESFEVPARIGPFRIRARIATGGMGTVFEAEQEHPRRLVALKVLREEMTSPELLRRFEYETQILAQLRHPGIAQVYDAGTFEHAGRRRPYFAMELIEGARPLGRFCDERGASIRDRVRLFVEVCDAVHHGHQRGVIHRDLKPANILVDREGHPKIIDFGVARAASAPGVTTAYTSVGQLLGTLQYMSPEQVSGDPAEIDTRSDVYALGVVLYELLTGAFPYDLEGRAIYEASQVIREESPARPSTRVATLRGDLETITLKALEKDKERRYASAHELGEDLRRFLRGDAILARPPSFFYQLQRFARRHRALTFAAVGVAVAVVAGFVSTTWGWLHALENTIETERERRRAVEARAEAEGERELAERAAYRAAIAAADASVRSRDVRAAQEYLDSAAATRRGWEWYYLSRATRSAEPALIGHVAPVTEVAVSPDGEVAVSVDQTGAALVWNLADQRLLGPVEDARISARAPITFLDARHFFAATEGGDLTVFSVDRRRALTDAYRLGDTLRTYTIEPDGSDAFWVALAIGDHVSLFHLPDKTEKRFELTQPAAAIAVAPSRARLAARGVGGGLWLWDVDTGLPLLESTELTRRLVSAVLAFDPIRNEIADATDDLSITIRSADTGSPVRRLLGHRDSVTDLVYDPHGTWLASTSEDATVRLWRASDGTPGPVLVGHRAGTTCVAFTPDGRRLVSGSRDGTIRIWSIDRAAPPDEATFRFLTVSPVGSWEVTQATYGWTLHVRDRSGSTAESTVDADSAALVSDFDETGGTAGVGFDDGSVRWIRHTESGEPTVRSLDLGDTPVRAVRSLPGNDRWIALTEDGVVHFLDGAAAREVGTLIVERPGPPRPGPARGARPPLGNGRGPRATTGFDLSPDATRILLGLQSGAIDFWMRDPGTDPASAASWRHIRRLRPGRGTCYALAFDATGEEALCLFGAPGDARREIARLVLGRHPSETDDPWIDSLGRHSAWGIVPSLDRSRFFVSLSDPARLQVYALDPPEPLLTISGDVALSYKVAGELSDGTLVAYDHRGHRVELEAVTADDERLRQHDLVIEIADELLSRYRFIERAVRALREQEMPAWAREIAYFHIRSTGDSYERVKSELRARLRRRPGDSTPIEVTSDMLALARSLFEYAPDDVEARGLLALALYRSGDPQATIDLLSSLPRDLDVNSRALRVLAAKALGKEREAGSQFMLLQDSLPKDRGVFEIQPELLRELDEALRGNTSSPE